MHATENGSKQKKSIEKLNESYFTELKVTDLSFKGPNFHLPLFGIVPSGPARAPECAEVRYLVVY